jgi:very-short-patch-repair endonuclease
MRYKIKVYLARKFRKQSTKSEMIMWEYLQKRRFLGLKFRRQYVCLNYIIDFYCYKLRLAIEIDGGIHNKQKIRDQLRQKLIERKGIKFIRIKSEEAENNIENVLIRLENNIKKIPFSTLVERGNKGVRRE